MFCAVRNFKVIYSFLGLYERAQSRLFCCQFKVKNYAFCVCQIFPFVLFFFCQWEKKKNSNNASTFET